MDEPLLQVGQLVKERNPSAPVISETYERERLRVFVG